MLIAIQRQTGVNALRSSFLVLILMALNSPINSQSFNEEWKTGKLSFPPWVSEGHSNSISSEISIAGKYAYKSELPAQVYPNPRSELRFEGNGTVPKFQDQFTTWGISFSVYVPPDFKPDPIKESILQFKDIMDPCDLAGGNPPFKIGLEEYDINATVRWTGQRCASALGLKYFGNLMKVRPGKWHYFILNVSWDYHDNGNGFIELYANVGAPPLPEHKVLDYRGPTGYNDNFGHYLKLGIYKWLWKVKENVDKSKSAGVKKRVLYYDDIIIKKGGIGLNDNQLPIVTAGPGKVISLPNNRVTLEGKANDPEGMVVSYQWSQVSGPGTASLNGENTATLEAGELKAGTYVFRLAVKDDQGATASDEVSVTVEAAPDQDPVADAGPDKALIIPDNGVILNGAVSGTGDSAVNFKWIQLSGPSDASLKIKDVSDLEVGDLIEGTYVFQLEVTDVNGRTGTDQVTVTLLAAAPLVTAAMIEAHCQASDGAISLDINGGTGPFSYSWSNGATTKDIDQIPAGDYQVTVTDPNGTAVKKSFTLKALKTNFSITAEISKASCSKKDGSIKAFVKGGVPPYRFKWSTGAITQNVEGLHAGKYDLLVTDSNGCSKGITFNVEVEPDKTEFALTSEVKGIRCEGEAGSIFLKMDGGNSGYSFSWSTGDTGPGIQNLEIGSYRVLIRDRHGCFMKADYLILPESQQTPVIFQSGDSLHVDITADQYQWYKEGIVIDGANQPFLKIAEQGAYLVQVSRGKNCSATSEPFLAQNSPEIPLNGRTTGTMKQVDFFPNPVSDDLNLNIFVNTSADVSVKIYDFLGNVVKSKELGLVDNQVLEQFNLSAYPAGVYLIEIRADQEVLTKRLIKRQI